MIIILIIISIIFSISDELDEELTGPQPSVIGNLKLNIK